MLNEKSKKTVVPLKIDRIKSIKKVVSFEALSS